MKTSRSLSRKEWDRIVDEAFSSGEVHDFSPRYVSRKNAMMRGITMKRHIVDDKNSSGSRRIALSVAAAAAAFAIVPAGLFIAGHSGGAGSPMTEVDVLPEETTAAEELPAEEATVEALSDDENVNASLREKCEQYGLRELQLSYVPEGLEYKEDGPYGGKYHDDNTGGGMSKQLYTVSDDAELVHQNFVWDTKEYDLEGKHVIVRYARSIMDDYEDSAHRYSRFIFVKFNDSPYMATLHIDNSYSDDEALKVCDGMELVPCEAADFHINYWKDMEPGPKYSEEVYRDSHFTKADIDKVTLYQIGDTFTNEARDGKCAITIVGARIQDDFDGITTDACGWDYDYSKYLDENGRIKKCLRTWYSSTPNGDPRGIVTSEEVKKRVVVLGLTYTNTSDTEEIEYAIQPEMFCYEDGYFRFVEDLLLIDGSDEVQDHVALSHHRGGYFSLCTDKKGSKNSVVLQPGESADVRVAFEIDDNDIGGLVCSIDPIHSNVASTMESYYYNAPMLDLRSLDIDKN